LLCGKISAICVQEIGAIIRLAEPVLIERPGNIDGVFTFVFDLNIKILGDAGVLLA